MRRFLTAGLAASLIMSSLVTAMPAQAQFSARDARQMCRDELRRQGVLDVSRVNVDSLGPRRFNVTGVAQRRNASAWFTCRVNNGRVRSVNIDRWQTGGGTGGGGSGAGTAAAVIGTALVLGAIAAAASSDKRRSDADRFDEYRDSGHPNYDQFSPSPGVICHRWQQTCYSNGSFSPGWTQREFGN